MTTYCHPNHRSTTQADGNLDEAQGFLLLARSPASAGDAA